MCPLCNESFAAYTIFLIRHFLEMIFFIIRNEKNAEVLLQAFPSALITGNDVGGTPLHLACCGTSASPIIVEMLLEKHEDMGYPIRSVDVSGE